MLKPEWDDDDETELIDPEWLDPPLNDNVEMWPPEEEPPSNPELVKDIPLIPAPPREPPIDPPIPASAIEAPLIPLKPPDPPPPRARPPPMAPPDANPPEVAFWVLYRMKYTSGLEGCVGGAIGI